MTDKFDNLSTWEALTLVLLVVMAAIGIIAIISAVTWTEPYCAPSQQGLPLTYMAVEGRLAQVTCEYGTRPEIGETK